jgi:hypothetical protein
MMNFLVGTSSIAIRYLGRERGLHPDGPWDSRNLIATGYLGLFTGIEVTTHLQPAGRLRTYGAVPSRHHTTVWGDA